MEDLTGRQQKILEFIKYEIHAKGYPPTVREIGESVGLSSSSTVHNHLTTLEKLGYIRKDPTKPRAIEIIDRAHGPVEDDFISIPLVGKVAAGDPIFASENIEDIFPMHKDLVPGGKNQDLFMLKIQGTSMIETGILDGDYVIVQKQAHANNGEIVVALIEDEATVKRFFKEKDYFRLQPENSTMDPIIVQDLQVLGKVIQVYRNEVH